MAVCTVGSDHNLAFTAYGTQLIARAEIDDIWIYENPNTLPRAYLVHHAETVPSDRLLERLFNTDFNFYHSVLLTTPLPSEQGRQLAALPVRPQGQVEITDYNLHRVDLNVTMSQPGILVLADAKYPGWVAIVNGSEQEIIDVNSIFRGIFLPAGNHSISFQFRPAILYWGLGLATLSTALAIAIVLVTYLRRKSDLVATH